jgi:hypothetical protein
MKNRLAFLGLLLFCGCSKQESVVDVDSKNITLDTGSRFAKALVAHQYSDAHSMLTSELQRSWSPEKLKSRYEEMVSPAGEPATVDGHTEFMKDWPDKKPGDIGWAYVSISGAHYAEAVTVIVAKVGDNPKIREIEWGRP